MSFTFEYDDVRYDAEGADHCLFGRIGEGSIHVGEPISVATALGDQIGVVNQFWDTLHDWLGMPFYHTVSQESIADPFCVRVHGLTAMPVCPGTASSPRPTTAFYEPADVKPPD